MSYMLCDIFNKDGDFVLAHFDPYRVGTEAEIEYRDKIFNSSGQLRSRVEEVLEDAVYNNGWSWDSDAVKCFHANVHGRSTKGSYPAIYYWR
ncbi:hypothetical protein VPLG_00119 [Vibrio phage eugene 12A10]|uniref:hypothetical protein n=1 Tax=Vibrio phage eugene 12A10 TaxID=573172 RepID=UPI00035167A8|nr:hypothetical protein VPLG_00119 [Vibrio phage eugene 12A10]AGN51558.1 hypothetical protein VPLG_00119 [Vibrio phage eugene 12A10]